MSLTQLGIIGAGSISAELVAVLAKHLPKPLEAIIFLVRKGKAGAINPAIVEKAKHAANEVSILEDINTFAATGTDLVIEAAGHGAVAAYAEQLLSAGIETVIASTGALSDPHLHARLEAAARNGGARLVLPAGAVGAVDVLAGLKYADLARVDYTSRKPPSAWAGTKAEDSIDLDAVECAVTFFEGSARDAAADYPKNANVAATVALAGLGFDETRVRLIADPSVTANVHTVKVESDAAEFTLRIEGKPSPANPKTSLPTVYSLAREVMRRVLPVVS